MLHYLTIGYLATEELARRDGAGTITIPVQRALRPLPPETMTLLRQMADPGRGDEIYLGGHPVEITPDYIRCYWQGTTWNRALEPFARAMQALGCMVADIGHGRIMPEGFSAIPPSWPPPRRES